MSTAKVNRPSLKVTPQNQFYFCVVFSPSPCIYGFLLFGVDFSFSPTTTPVCATAHVSVPRPPCVCLVLCVFSNYIRHSGVYEPKYLSCYLLLFQGFLYLLLPCVSLSAWPPATSFSSILPVSFSVSFPRFTGCLTVNLFLLNDSDIDCISSSEIL